MAVSPGTRRFVLERDGYRCRICRRALATTIDHIWPQVRGGTDDPENLQAACRPCNSRKNAHVPAGLLPLFTGVRAPKRPSRGRVAVLDPDAPECCEIDDCDPVGSDDIAERLDVRPDTVRMWRHRGLFPEPRWTVSGRPCWNWPDVERWAEKTGRLPA